jgi:hypothetical protein
LAQSCADLYLLNNVLVTIFTLASVH